MFYALVVAHIIMAGTFLIRIGRIPPQIPLFYSRPWGEFQLADWWLIFLLIVLMDALYFINLGVSRRYFKDNEFIQHTLSYVNIAVISGFTLIFMKIIFLST